MPELVRGPYVRVDEVCSLGKRAEDFVVVPFPIQEMQLLRHCTPAGAVHFVRAYSACEWEKVRRIRAHEIAVEVLDPGSAKQVSGTGIREALRDGSPLEHLVPTGSVGAK
ncbi:MAG TPA: hypothetical protein VFJ72_12555 [Rubrobacteraceae bacterium]|nr:hypothetical protein [Rubrobacteraceae bacterium]